MRRAVAVLVTALLSVGAALGLVPAHATSWTSSSYAARLVQLVNQARQQNGIGSLTIASGTSQVAAAWTAHLDAAQSLSHNPDLRHQLETHGSTDWRTYGENVGQGPADDPDTLFQAYMNSPEHRSNILNSAYRFTGVAVILDGKTAWNTFDFVDSYHSASSASSASAPQAKPKSHPKPHSTATTPVAAPVSTHSGTTSTAASVPRVTRPAHRATRAAKPRTVSRGLPHTGARAQAAPPPNLAQLLGGSASRTGASTAVLAASVAPLSSQLPASSQLVIALAGLVLGFVGVRWWHVARAA